MSARFATTLCTLFAAALALLPGDTRAEPDPGPGRQFVTFESGPVRPLALSADGGTLYAVNTPDNRLEILRVTDDGIEPFASVPVGLEPVAVAVRGPTEVWVVNHLSDSVSVVNVGAAPRVVRTLLVGDEPRDLVFAGSGGNRAFVTTAHRGQNDPADPELTTQGVGRANVWVFDADALGDSLGGDPLSVVTLFCDTPRALAVTPDGTRVYVAAFHSGNRTTTVGEGFVCDGFDPDTACVLADVTSPGGLPGPDANHEGVAAPETGIIVGQDPATGLWEDELGRDWSDAVRFSLPDRDVFVLDADANPPVATRAYSGVGTVLFNMVVNPRSGLVYVSNTEANNRVRFEGTGKFGGSTVRGELHRAAITVLDPFTDGPQDVFPRRLNKHIDYGVAVARKKVAKKTLATPMQMVVSADGQTLYVAAFGSGAVGVFDTAALERDEFKPSSKSHIAVTGGGPSGLVLDEARGRLYVSTRFDNGLSVVDTDRGRELRHLTFFNPEPDHVVRGRPLLYDAARTSSNGEASCSSCHVFGDLDSLAWDLGDPDGDFVANPNPILPPFDAPLAGRDFHPMKGPMTTQSLRGMANHGPMHWRGDRTGGSDVGGDPLDEQAAFETFNVAFPGLLGRKKQLTAGEMEAFAKFALSITYPPNPIRNLDDSLTPSQQRGRDFYFGDTSDGVGNCNVCHVLDREAGFFGSDGTTTFEGEPQFFKVPHLRNLYQKVGMFGMPWHPAFFNQGDNGPKGDQIRGFGFLHDGSTDTLFRFHSTVLFNFDAAFNPGGFQNDDERRDMEQFMLAFDSNLAPVVGQQVTLTSLNGAVAGPRIDLLEARAAAGDCDLVVHGRIGGGEPRGWLLLPGGLFAPDGEFVVALTSGELRALAVTPGQELTFTAAPPDTGVRTGLDRDGDGVLNRDERNGGSDPADAASVTGETIVCVGGVDVSRAKLKISRNLAPAGDEKLKISGEIRLTPDVTPDGAVDPMEDGFSFKLAGPTGESVLHRVVPGGAPVSKAGPGWSVNRNRTVWRYVDKKAAVSDGIVKVTVTDLSAKSPGLYRFKVTGKGGDFLVDPAAGPFTLIVVLGAPARGGDGVCGAVTFGPADGPSPRCRSVKGGAVLSCK